MLAHKLALSIGYRTSNGLLSKAWRDGASSIYWHNGGWVVGAASPADAPIDFAPEHVKMALSGFRDRHAAV